MMRRPKYVAEGFYEDALKLLNEFVEKNSVEFPDFASVWRNNHFSLIYMGRPEEVELSEFTNEAYRISSNFLSSSSFKLKVGAVFLLYGLYRNQIAKPPIKIRTEFNQWKILMSLHEEAIVKKYRTLHCVIDYLIKNAFLYVAQKTLRGPVVGSMMKISKNHEAVTNLKANYKSDLKEYNASNSLQNLRDLQSQYFESKKKLNGQVKVNLDNNINVYENFIGELNNLLNPPNPSGEKEPESLGSRRAKIKAESFTRQTRDRFGKLLEDVNSEMKPNEDFGTVKKRTNPRPKRLPKHERKVGRPSKKPKDKKPVEENSDDDIDITHLLNQQQELYLPPEELDAKKLKSRPGRYYYKLSPKRESDSSSDSDNPLMLI